MKFTVLDTELEYDFTDADLLDRAIELGDEASRRMTETENTEYEKSSDLIRAQCSIVEDFFDGLFGDGTSDRVFQGKKSLRNHIEAFMIVVDASNDTAPLDELSQKYDPERFKRNMNREQRRRFEQMQNRKNHGGNGPQPYHNNGNR